MKKQEVTEQIANQEQTEALIKILAKGSLNSTQQAELAELLKTNSQSFLIMARMQHQQITGPIPPPEYLAKYDEKARNLILDMGKKEQQYTHDINIKALNGAIKKDRLVQVIGGVIAVVGLAASAWIAQYSAVAAGIIATLDLFGMVALFVAPRILESKNKQT